MKRRDKNNKNEVMDFQGYGTDPRDGMKLTGTAFPHTAPYIKAEQPLHKFKSM